MKRFVKPLSLVLFLTLLLSLCSCAAVDWETLAQAVGETAEQLEQAERELNVAEPLPEASPENAVPGSREESAVLVYGGEYYGAEEVALYLHLYRELPPNYLRKNEAREAGWDSSEGNLWDVLPGSCIGGDHFGNYEEQLPEGEWTECDVNYQGGFRNSERLVYNASGAIYYTDDHYESFTQLYEAWAS